VFDTHAVNPSVLPNLPYDTLRDLAPIMLIGTSPMVITSHPATAYRSFADLVAAARKSDGAINYGTVGAGSLAHLAMTRIANGLKVTMTHVPYRGGGPLLTDAIAGHIPVTIASIALLSPQISSGALRALAVTSSSRYAWLPDIPTVTELGLAIDAQSWWGLLAPAKTPSNIIMRMHDALAKALDAETVRQNLSEQGVIYRLSSPEELGRFLEAEIPRWAQVVKNNRIVASE
jgi:tripartite-type tricarboxylate transporter receptor subunit TctC